MIAKSQQVHITVTLFCFTHFSVHREISIQSLGNKGRIRNTGEDKDKGGGDCNKLLN